MAGSISSLGVGSGLELRSMLEQLRKNEEQSFKTPLENKKARLNEQLKAFNQLSQKVLDIRSDALKLGLNTTFMSRSVNVGNSAVLSATVNEGTITGSHQVTVNRLATKSSWMSATGVNSQDAVVTTTGGTLKFKVGNGEEVTINVDANTTLRGLVDEINKKNAGVTATIVNTGVGSNPYKLAITANNTGESNRITITGQLAGFTLVENQGANGASLNAEIVLNGVTYQRGSNSGINDIIGGLTINLNGTGTTTVDITENRNQVKDLIKGFVEKVNAFVDELKTQTGYDKDGKPGILGNVTSVRALRFDITNMMTKRIANDGNIKSMVDLGIEINRDGSITLDEAKLDRALQTNFDEVRKFFVGEGKKKGFADFVAETMNSLTRLGSGVLAIEENNAKTNIQKIDAQIEAMSLRIEKRFNMLEKQFQQLDSFLAGLKSLGNYLSRQFDSLSSLTASKNK